MSPLGHWAYGQLSMVTPYPGSGSRPATRARRPRPSEKTALRVIPGLSPQGHLILARPPEGQALHARKRKLELDRDISPFGRGLSLAHVVEMQCLGPSSALPPGRGDRAPPRKPLSALSPGFPRKATSPWLAPRRGGLRTPEKASLGMIHTSQKGEQAPLSFNLRESAPRPYLGTHRLLRIRGLVFDTKGRLE
jgi:hypothetical protein